MVQILPRPESSSDRFAKAFGNLGSSLAQSIPQELMGRQERAQLSELMGRDVKNIRNPDFLKQMLSSHLDKELMSSKLKGEFEADKANYKKIKEAFGQKFADVWLATGQGERTALTKAALQARARGIDLEKLLSLGEMGGAESSPASPFEQLQSPEEPDLFEKLQNISATQDTGLLPEEKVSRGKERYATGLKEYQEATTILHDRAQDKERLNILESLNASDKLPKNLSRLNVDKEGNLKLPFLASADAQRYVKTLNEFSSGAKGTFGARVTNFDLAQYMKRFPTLLNTKEGRRQLLEQMKLVNQLNSVYYKNLKKVYDEAGGVRNIDSDRAEYLAEKLSEPITEQLTQKFKQIGQFSSKPSPAEFKGKRIRDKETGEIFISNGENWIPE